jgi:hypothetical protein
MLELPEYIMFSNLHMMLIFKSKPRIGAPSQAFLDLAIDLILSGCRGLGLMEHHVECALLTI